MAYRLKPGRAVAREVRRIAAAQLRLAMAGVQGTGDRRHDDAVHDARRHIKKTRALARLARGALGRRFAAINARLRGVHRLLAPIADGLAVVDTLTRLAARYPGALPRDTVVTLRRALARREAALDRRAVESQALPAAVATLQQEAERLRVVRLSRGGFGAVAPGFYAAVRGARRAMRRAVTRPTASHYHAWRRRVKDHWFAVRLLDGRCGGALAADAAALEALDGCLGEQQNCVLLQQALTADPMVSRDETARCLRLVRRYRHELRQDAQRLAGPIYAERPRQAVARARAAWRAAARTAPPDRR